MAEPADIPRTFLDGPSDPITLADGLGTVVRRVVDAPPGAVWQLVTDLDLPARFSEEFLGATWEGDGPGPGATFVGRNHHPAVGGWEVRCFVTAFEDGRTFGWCTSDPEHPGASWRFDLMDDGDRTLLTYALTLGPGPSGLTPAIEAMPEQEERILLRRLAEHHANMVRTVEGIAALAEGREPDAVA